MNRLRQTVLIALVLVAVMAMDQTPRSHSDPAPNRPAKPSTNFIDFNLKRLNPEDIDYGQRVEEMRNNGMEATVDDYYFWSNLVAFAALFIAFSMYYRLNVVDKRREWSTARVVSWCHNALVEARRQAFEWGEKYTELKRIMDDQIEARSSQEQQSAGDKETITNLRQQVTLLTRQLQDERQKNRNLKGA